MSITFKSLARAAVTTSATTVYTVPASTITVLKELNFANSATAARKLRVFIVPTGDSPVVANSIVYDFSIPANGILPLSYHMVLNAGDRLQVQADATGVTVFASGIEEALS